VERICPGQYLGLASVWIVVATLLAKFNISPAKDEDGKNIMPVTEFTTGITRFDLTLLLASIYVILNRLAHEVLEADKLAPFSHPVPFSAIFTPRNAL
jgi:hypothetical protein